MNTIAFFPEGAYGPALNSVGIAQACRQMGHRVVFICDPGFRGVFAEYGFEEFEVNLSKPMPPPPPPPPQSRQQTIGVILLNSRFQTFISPPIIK